MRGHGLAGAAVVLGFIACPVHGQSAPSQTEGASPGAAGGDQLQEVIVTANKRSENLQNVPIAVSAVSGDTLTKAAITDIVDLRVTVPGLNLSNTYGRLTASIRGIGTTGVGPGFESPVALYVDGVYYASGAASVMSLNDIAQVEVLKGPQGTLFGRNATAGLVQITTRTPTEETTGFANVSYGNYQTVSGNAYLAGGLAENLAADVAVYASHQGQGYGRNTVTGDDVYQMDEDIAVRSKVLFTPSDLTKLTLIGDYSHTIDSLEAVAIPPGGRSPFLPDYVQPLQGSHGYDVSSTQDPQHSLWNYGVSLRWDQKLGPVNLATISAYRASEMFLAGDLDALPAPITDFVQHQPDSQFTQEVQVSSATSTPLSWTAGLFYYSGITAAWPVEIASPEANNTVDIFARERMESEAGYAQASYQIVDDTNITLGGRYTREWRHEYDGVNFIYDTSVTPPAETTAPTDPQSVTFDKFTWRASLDHRFSSSVLGYVSFNTGFKSGGYNLYTHGGPSYKPETLDAYEIGIKTDLLDKRVRLNAAAFYDKYKDVQVQQYVALVPDTTNGAAARSYGLDMDVTALVTEGLTLTAGGTWLNDKFTSFDGCTHTVVGGGVPIFPGNCTGNQLPLAAKLTLNSSVDYDLSLAGGELNLNTNAYYNSGWYTESDDIIRQGGFVELGASAKYTFAGDHLNVGIYGRNLTNRRVLAYAATQAAGTQLVSYEFPRTYGVNFGCRF